MSDSLYVAVRTEYLPGSSEVEAALHKVGFGVKLHPDWNPQTDLGFVNIDLEGKEIGCEVFPLTEEDDDPDDAFGFSLTRLRKTGHAECDRAFELAFRDEKEAKGAVLLGFALATTACGAVSVDDENEEKTHSGDALRAWLQAEIDGLNGQYLQASGPPEIDPVEPLKELLDGLKGQSIRNCDHHPLQPDRSGAASEGFGHISYASALSLEFSNGVSIGGPVWTMTNDAGLSLSAMHASRYDKRPDKVMKQLISDRRKAGHENPEAVSRIDLVKLDHQALIAAVAALEKLHDTATVSDVSFAAPNWVRLYFSDVEKTVIGFVCPKDRAQVHVRNNKIAFSLRQSSVLMDEIATLT